MKILTVFILAMCMAAVAQATPDPECAALDWSSPRDTTPYITLSGVIVGCAPDNNENMTVGVTIEGIDYTQTNVEPLNKFAIAAPFKSDDAVYTYWAEDSGGRSPEESRPFHFPPAAPIVTAQ